MVSRIAPKQEVRSHLRSSTGLTGTFLEQRIHSRGDTLFGEGDRATHLVHIREGLVKLVKHSRQGKDVIVEICGPGTALGEMSLLDQNPYDVTAICISPAVTFWESLAMLRSKNAEAPDVLLDAVRSLSARLRESQATVRNLAVERVEARIAIMLVKLAERPMEPAFPSLTIPLTRQELADAVGATIETTIRTLSRFVQAGAVERRNRGLLVTDLTYLKSIMVGDVPRSGGPRTTA